MAKILTLARRERLEKLASYLESLPADYRHFEMRDFMVGAGRDSQEAANYALNNGGVAQCGTIACAVGHGPAAGILVPAHMVTKGWNARWTIAWHDYADLFVGAHDWGQPGARAFVWMFGGGWSHCDNHHHGAAARIRYYLERQKIPRNFQDPGQEWMADYAPYRAAQVLPTNPGE